MDVRRVGVPTYHTRVERWECDYNDHWNVRFYGRSFQMAAETVAVRAGQLNPGAAATRLRHMRFHRELRVSAPVEVRSAVLRDAGNLDGAVAHLLTSGGQISATALDLSGKADHLPSITAVEIADAMPRGITEKIRLDPPPADARLTEVELGPIGIEELDHTGRLRFETVLRHASTIQHCQLNELGLTPEFANSHRINRMGVEFRVMPGMTPSAGALLCGQSWVTAIKGKAIWAISRITDTSGAMVANIEMCVITVNLDSRKAVPVPEFIHRALRT